MWKKLVPDGVWHHLARIVFSPKRPSQMHTHDFPEIFWIESGNVLHEINGVFEKLCPGDMVFIRASDRHQLRAADSTGFEMVNIAFPASVLADLKHRHSEIENLHSSQDELPRKLSLRSHQIRRLNEDLRILMSGSAARMAVERLLLGIYLLSVASPSSNNMEALPEWLARACRVINRPENFVEGVPAFMRLCGRSPEHVARTCRFLLGKSPTDLVNAARLAHAARELRLGTKSIIEIALECGFNNLAHFYELFRTFQGTTPRRYRLECQRGVA